MTRRLHATTAIVLVASAQAPAQSKYQRPWEPAADAAAEQAVARLGGRIALDVTSKVFTIPALTTP